jgi:hypothetical protein
MLKPHLESIPAKRPGTARRIAVFVAIYALIGFFILPPILRAVALKQLSQQLDREVSIEKVKLNPFALSITVRGLLIKDKDGQPFVSWDEVYVNFQLSSLFGHPWVFSEVSTTKPYVRVQMNPDRSLNFSDLLAKFSSTNAPPGAPAKPLALRIHRLRIAGATASLADLTPRTPFKRLLGPIDITLENFHTDPGNKNPYSFSGTTDAGESFAWSGHFYLAPIRSAGEVSLKNLSLNKYAPLYQDLVRFKVKDGVADMRATYRFEFGATNRVATVTNASFALHSFTLAEPSNETNLVELREFSVAGVSLDVSARRADVASVSVTGAKLFLQRDKSRAVNLVQLAQPAATATNAPGGILLLLQSVTNAVAQLLQSTNLWAATLHEVQAQDCALNLEDLANSRPARLNLDNITLTAKNISNVPATNLTASLALRWNTNGSIKADVTASFLPPTADVQLTLEQLELQSLDPCLEPVVNIFILGSKLGMNGLIRLRTTNAELPQVTFRGDIRLDDFSTADAVLGEELLKWGSVRVSGIDANLNPQVVAIKEIAVDDLSARVLIETNRTINLLAALGRSGTNAPAAEPERQPPVGRTEHHAGSETGVPSAQPATSAPEQNAAKAAAPPGQADLPKISVATIVISNAQMRFTDRSVRPNVNLTIQQAGGMITGLSSEELQPAEMSLHAKVDNVGPVDITGTVNPFSQTRTNELKIAVKDMDLTPTSPYAGKFAGYRIARGKLNLALAYHIQGRNLKSENLITLDQFTFGDKVDSPDATKLPVRLAIAILKDRNGKIELDVPIEGSLDDPAFRLNKVVVHAIMNILTKVATSPFSLLGALFGGKGEEVRYQDFAPGSAELLVASRDKLDALVKGLYERPALQLEIEGSIDPETDLDGLRRVRLEKLLRTEKWQALRKSVRTTTTPEQVTLEADERASLIKKLYSEALSKGKIAPANAKPSTQVPSTAAAAKAKGSTAAGAAPVRSDGLERGASTLMQSPETKAVRPEVPAANTPKRAVPGDPIELALLASFTIGDSDFAALAAERAKAVRAYIQQTGKVEPERVFLTEIQPGGVKTQGSRAYLQLR